VSALPRNARLPGTQATSVAIEGDRIAWGGTDEVVHVEGAHVHAVRTGLALTQLDLAGATSRADLTVRDVPGGLDAAGWPALHPDLPLPTARRTPAAGATIWKADE
jgi:hypothetical protein